MKYKETEIGLLPEDWEVIKLGDFLEVKSGSINFSKIKDMQYDGKDSIKVLAIKVSDMNLLGNENVILQSVIEFNVKANTKLIKYLIKPDSLIFPKRGAAISTNKKRVTKFYSVLDPNLIAVEPNPDYFNYIFLFYYFKTVDLRKLTDNNTIPQLNKKDIVPLLIPKPSHKEQNKIVAILDILQNSINSQSEIIQNLQVLKKALMQKLFTEGLNGELLKDTEIGKIPKSWQVVQLKDTGDVIYGIQAAVANNTKPIGTKILTNVNITLDGKINLEKVRYYKLKTKRDFNTMLKKGDILFNWRSGSKEHVGKTAIFDLDGEWTHSSFILRIRPIEKVNNYYLFLYLFYLRTNGYFVKQQTYSVNAKFNKSAIEVMPVALPSIEEQNQIAESITALENKITLNIKRKKDYEQLFNNLLSNLMTGKIRVKDIEI